MSRCPATPLIVHDPYFSIWSAADRINQDITRHWTGRPMGLETLVRIDGATFVLTGAVPGFAAVSPGFVPGFPGFCVVSPPEGGK